MEMVMLLYYELVVSYPAVPSDTYFLSPRGKETMGRGVKRQVHESLQDSRYQQGYFRFQGIQGQWEERKGIFTISQ